MKIFALIGFVIHREALGMGYGVASYLRFWKFSKHPRDSEVVFYRLHAPCRDFKFHHNVGISTDN